MKINVIFCLLLLVGVVTVVSQVAEKPDDASPFQHLLTKELGRMAKNIRKQLHSEMAELVEELRQKFLETTIHVETVSVNTSLAIHENMTKEKNVLEDRFMKVVNYTNHQMEELTNDLQYLQLAVKGDINPYDFQKLLVSEAPMPDEKEEDALIFLSSDTYQNDQSNLLYSEESSYDLDEAGLPDSTTPAVVAAAAMRPEELAMTLNITRPRSCYELYQKGNTRNGIYIIYPEGSGGMGIKVWCVMELDDGGWTVILARLPDAEHVEFDRPMHDYIIGFGQPTGHYWMGLRHVESMCGFRAQELKVYIQDWDGNHAIADYNNFNITKSNESWSLQISGYDTESTAGDALTPQNGAMFTPEEKTSCNDNSPDCTRWASQGDCQQNASFMRRNCKKTCNKCPSKIGTGGWWHSKMGGANPTGIYYTKAFFPQGVGVDGVAWPTWRGGVRTSLKKLLIMIRSKN